MVFSPIFIAAALAKVISLAALIANKPVKRYLAFTGGFSLRYGTLL